MERRNFLAAIGGLLGLGAVAKAAVPKNETLEDKFIRELAAKLRGLSGNEAREYVNPHTQAARDMSTLTEGEVAKWSGYPNWHSVVYELLCPSKAGRIGFPIATVRKLTYQQMVTLLG